MPATSITGRAVVRLPAVGWLLRMLPWLVAGTVSVLIFTMGMGVPLFAGLGQRRREQPTVDSDA